MKIIILTGNETRHKFFRKTISADKRISVISSYCEGAEKSLENRVKESVNSSALEIQHVNARAQAEKDFFDSYIKNLTDMSCPKFLSKGQINDDIIVNDIIKKNPDLIICYGSSLIKSVLLEKFKGRFLNVHLGLSPYYRGSGTNIWPLINGEPGMVGATYMYIDSGIDTGHIIHQIRAEIFLGDSPHSIGNRLIKKMTFTYADIIANFEELVDEEQPKDKGKLYLKKDFNSEACYRLYQNFNNGIVEKHLNSEKKYSYIVENSGLKL